jgi:hypothetical protein
MTESITLECVAPLDKTLGLLKESRLTSRKCMQAARNHDTIWFEKETIDHDQHGAAYKAKTSIIRRVPHKEIIIVDSPLQRT